MSDKTLPSQEQNKPEIQTRKFDDLSPRQVANLYALRYDVFVREQKSIFDEHDGHDFDATHIFIEENNIIIAYARAYPTSPNTATFGRVAVHPKHRNRGLGRQIVQQTLSSIKNMEAITEVDIEAQEYLKQFYESFGFVQNSEPFDDEGVMHVEMKLRL